MKTGRVLWGVMLLAAFLSCSRAKPGFCPPATSAGSTLAAIDSLMGQQPDSALSLLLAFSQTHDTERLAPYDRHRFHLFLSEALYGKHIKGDTKSKLILTQEVTAASVHGSQPTDMLLEESDKGHPLFGDSAYVGQEETLEEYGMRDGICENGYRGHPLTEEQKRLKRKKSKTRCIGCTSGR